MPAWYQLHGTIPGVWSESYVQLKDYMSFRHNIGSGGTGVVTFAAMVTLL